MNVRRLIRPLAATALVAGLALGVPHLAVPADTGWGFAHSSVAKPADTGWGYAVKAPSDTGWGYR